MSADSADSLPDADSPAAPRSVVDAGPEAPESAMAVDDDVRVRRFGWAVLSSAAGVSAGASVPSAPREGFTVGFLVVFRVRACFFAGVVDFAVSSVADSG